MQAQPERRAGAGDVATAENTPHYRGPACGGKVEQHNFVQIRKQAVVFLTRQEGEGSATRQQQQQQFLRPWTGSSTSTAKPQVVLCTAGAVLNVTLFYLIWLGVPRREN